LLLCSIQLQADEKELAKKLALVEKERKDHEKEVLKRSKQEQKAIDQARRDEERAEEMRRKEANKTVEKAQREQSKKNDKFRAQFKKEINAELRKNRSEANSALLQFFDEEEEVSSGNQIIHIFYLLGKLQSASNFSRRDGMLSSFCTVCLPESCCL
jgi:seryl-tRNA synthetase